MRERRVLAVIPARGGSVGVPRKNVRPMAGKPLIAHTIEHCLACSKPVRTIVSTDDKEIAEIARDWGAEVPFTRPEALAGNSTPMIPVIIHAVDAMADLGFSPDIVAVLQPTVPLRPPTLLADAVARSSTVDSVVCVTPVHHHPYWMQVVDSGFAMPFLSVGEIPSRRQDLPLVFAITGSVYAISLGALRRRRGMDASFATRLPGERVGALVVEGRYALDIDTEEDFAAAEIASGGGPSNESQGS